MAKSCLECKKELEPEWHVCPYCGSIIPDQIRLEVNYNQGKKLNIPIAFLNQNKSRNYEFLFLLMLQMNEIVTWNDFKTELNIAPSSLSKYLHVLLSHGFIERLGKGGYSITKEGKKRLKTIELNKNQLPKSFDIWKQKRDYELLIIEMLQNPSLKDYLEKFIGLLERTIQDDSSSQLIILIYKWLENREEDYCMKLKNDIIKRYADSYGVIEREALFFMDAEILNLEKIPKMFEMFRPECFSIGELAYYGIKEERTPDSIDQQEIYNPYYPIEATGESHIYYIVKDGHVVALNLYYNDETQVPESLLFLTELEYLIIGPETHLPDGIEKLKKLHINENPYPFDE
jgi:hypothetical protein